MAAPFSASVVARVPIATAPLGLVLLVRDLRDAWDLAGLVTGVFAVGLTLGTPFWGRGLDRHGQPRVLVPTATASAALLVVLTAAVATPAVPAAALVLLALGAGLTFPPLSPAMRTTWRAVVADEGVRRRGYALDAVAVETLFVAGPLLLTLLLAVGPAVVPLLVTALMLAGGTLAYCRCAGPRQRLSPAARSETAVGAGAGLGVLRAVGIPAVLTAMAAMSIGFGLLDVSMAGMAEQRFGSADDLGVLFAAIASGSAVGGLLYGSRSWRSADRLRLVVTLAGFGTLLVALSASAGSGAPLPLLLAALFVTGLFISPNLIAAQHLVDDLVPVHRMGEAQAWLSTAITAGAAIGNAVAGGGGGGAPPPPLAGARRAGGRAPPPGGGGGGVGGVVVLADGGGGGARPRGGGGGGGAPPPPPSCRWRRPRAPS
ncbi:MFS transporter [Kineococcus auxinigenes]|uniref:MFS transporter n=1 Tax=Kineococcus sp. SYSU DK033 TaxID=3383154 RepID=UPI003D7CCA43